MFWFVLGTALFIFAIVSTIKRWNAIAISSFIVAIFFFLISGITAYNNDQKIGKIQASKICIESLESNGTSNSDTQKEKTELNTQLYQAQISVQNYPFFTLYPKTVLNIKPIN